MEVLVAGCWLIFVVCVVAIVAVMVGGVPNYEVF